MVTQFWPTLCVLIWSVTWKFNDQVLEDTELYHFEKYEDTHCLEVKDVEKQDAGPYTCIAVNTEGDATCQIPLVVNGKIQLHWPVPLEDSLLSHNSACG